MNYMNKSLFSENTIFIPALSPFLLKFQENDDRGLFNTNSYFDKTFSFPCHMERMWNPVKFLIYDQSNKNSENWNIPSLMQNLIQTSRF